MAAAASTARPRPGRHRALTALLLLAPGTPLFFQGQEFSASHTVLLLCRSRARAEQAGARGAAGRDAKLPPPGGRRRGRAICRSRATSRRSSVRSSTGRNANRNTAALATCTATCCGCGAKTRCSPPKRADRIARRGDRGDEAFLLRFFGDGWRRPAAAGESGPRHRLVADYRTAGRGPRGAPLATCCGRAKILATADLARRRLIRSTGSFPAMPRSCSLRSSA